MASVAEKPAPQAPFVALPRTRKRTKTYLLLLAILCPPLAIYLDGASSTCIITNVILWIPTWLVPGIIHAWFYILRSQYHRNISRPVRSRLWVQNDPRLQKEFELQENKRRRTNLFSITNSEIKPLPPPGTVAPTLPTRRPTENPFRDPSTGIDHALSKDSVLQENSTMKSG
ncbi:hypothetical protein BU24DRAFT_199254 [Aaosphaeria arxii CBS 175.79]|uniref:Uncharacterized protein n=1 Tax=Aaosphaeria arxii CBS 175.79 TaxID=1450172 RepID=A0A6A5XU40_9PLEO|nr:uncharacterized protein BU24DRAFT_199254 [Aaosphaeria arxii CBS 175.79]KAF2016327.1 hypothetical protein BU24DRAFT_199254 [Aaosphaeria arxii CBS 175.79]